MQDVTFSLYGSSDPVVAHGPIMRSLLNWRDEAAVVHWTQPEAELPGWEEAHRRLQQDGRRPK